MADVLGYKRSPEVNGPRLGADVVNGGIPRHSKVMPGNLMPTVIAAPLRNASLASNVVGRQLARASAQSEIA
jgi:hypothetical protein